MADKRFDDLKQKYQSVFRVMQQQQVQLQNVNLQGDKLYVRGEAPSEQAKNRVWDEIKLVDPSYSDLICDLRVSQTAAAGAGSGPPATGGQTYTVQPGDTLSKIAQRYYGDASQYVRIFQANRDKLTDPNRIRPGQELVIPD